MKKILFLTAAIVLVSISADAQNRFAKGDWFLGAQTTSLGMSQSFFDGSATYTDLNLNGIGGWFFSNKFALEAGMGLSASKRDGYDGTSKLNVTIGIRYYPVANFFLRFVESGYVGTNTDFYTRAAMYAGYDLFLSEKVYFEPAVYYVTDIEAPISSALGASVGIGIRF